MNKQRILIVDDNPTNLKLASTTLRYGGYEIGTAVDAESAQEILKTTTFDLILMDIGLPGMDGLTLTKHLKSNEKTRQTPIVVITAFAMKGDEEKAFAAGCNGYITKPINTRTFAAQVAAFLPKADASSS